MKSEFPGFFSSAADDIDKMWDECLFVLDANILLNLYRYSDSTCEKLLGVFEALGDRLWIPHQVALEYLNNRLTVIGEQGKVYDDAVKKVEALKRSLENHNQHPFVSEVTLKESLAVFERLVAELIENKRIHDKRISSDEIKDKLGELLDGKVGQVFSRERLEQVLKDGQIRYEQKTPPGFCDAKKFTDSVVFDEKCRPFGDYIVWLQILDKAKNDGKPVIFVTGDSKEDWWASFQGKTLGPQPKLIEEFLSIVGFSFYMYPPDRFMERASEYLNQAASEEAVKEIRDVQVDAKVSLERNLDLVNSWLEKSTPNKWYFNKTLASWMKDSDAALRGKEAKIRTDLHDARIQLRALAELLEDMVLLNVNRDDQAYGKCVESVRNMTFLVSQLEAELESVRHERLTLTSNISSIGMEEDLPDQT
ncbi:PIN domain-containing protein [Pseudomonas sp. LB3P38]|uniref:PIN domain-containing protein n=1 Tax=Pseudomonas lyxosi TaxID=3398358 RepID=UPI0039F0C8EA